MEFWKAHGIGNDFIIINGINDNKNDEDYSEFANTVCNRRLSVGADGLLVIKKSTVSDIKMVYYNADGSRASMCGNGIRCFAKYVYDNNIVKQDEFTIETLDGIKLVKLHIENDEIISVKVNMGNGSFSSKDIPAQVENETVINYELKVADKNYNLSAMLMGVPHAVIIVDKLDQEEVIKYGSMIEKNKIFPKGINVNFVQIIDDRNINVKTWERGCGYTLGCGTGMTASVILCNKLGYVNNSVNVSSEGGIVKIDVEDTVYMTGPATKICEGILEVN